MSAVRLLAASSLLWLPLAACSLLVDTSGLDGGAAGGPGADGDGSAAPADAPADSPGNTDSPSSTYAPPDGGADVVDSSVPTCLEADGRFCDDFDDPNPGARWTSTDTKRGTATFDAVGLSLPHAFQAKVVAGSGSGDANLVKTYPSARAHVRCELDLKLFNVPTSGEIDVIDFDTNVPGAQSYHVYFALFNNQWAVAEYQGRPDAGDLDRLTQLGAALPNDTWFHVVLDHAGTTATLTANGTVATLGSLTVPANGTDTSISVGITYTSSDVQAARLAIDNVDCTVAP